MAPASPSLNSEGCDAHSDTSSEASAVRVKMRYSDVIDDDHFRMNSTLCLDGNGSILIESSLGQGTFGKIFGIRHVGNNQQYALKVLPYKTDDQKRWCEGETRAMLKIQENNAHLDHLNQFFALFYHQDNMCIMMERLDIDLWKYLHIEDMDPLSYSQIRTVAIQLLTAAARLHSMGLVHTDIKPENIMFVNRKKGINVKLVDYGSSTTVRLCTSSQGAMLQTIFYRSPEVLFGLPLSERIDIWSIGCVIAEIYMGYPLYSGTTEYQMIKIIASTQGIPQSLHTSDHCSKYMVSVNSKVQYYDAVSGTRVQTVYRMKSSEECLASGVDVGIDQRYYRLSSLKTILDHGSLETRYHAADSDDDLFVAFLSSLLALNANKRPSADLAKKHDFLRNPGDRDLGDDPVVAPVFLNPLSSAGPLRSPRRKSFPYNPCGVQCGGDTN